MQSFTDIASTTTLTASRSLLINNDYTAMSSSSGTAFPTENLVVGMLCYRTDLNQMYVLVDTTPTWIVVNSSSVSMASASTMNIGAATGSFIIISGTTAIKAFDTIHAGVRRILRFTEALTVTYSSSAILLPGSASITVAAGDVMEFLSLGSGVWVCVDYQPIVGYLLQTGGDISGATTFSSTVSVTGKTTLAGALACAGAATLTSSLTVTGVTSLGSTLAVTGAITATGGVVGALTGNASTATKLATARTIELTGDVTGSGSFDGSGNLSITTTSDSVSNGKILYTASGTFTVPDNVTSVWITLVGGGGGGGGGSYFVASSGYPTSYTGGDGGDSIAKICQVVTGLTSGTTITVTVGAAGTAGSVGSSSYGGSGGTGGASSFGSYISAVGGSGGTGSGTDGTSYGVGYLTYGKGGSGGAGTSGATTAGDAGTSGFVLVEY